MTAAITDSGTNWMAMTVESGEHHMATTGEFDRKAVLDLARNDTAVTGGENAGGGGLGGGARRDVEQSAHGVARGPLKRPSSIQIPREVCVRCASIPPAKISPATAHDHLLRIEACPVSRAVEPALRFALQVRFIVIVTVAEGVQAVACKTLLRLRSKIHGWR
jgi:hypothetical protein